ncbi:hypothetical protein GKC30_13520 [Pseudodesulfovibrio sp. F-1]|uniref:Uncharacterized protein n=1 Tax=Pseudodesulfovibrio alkaliphilus TaxID=2661613 RepID=A0A7K1KRE1_9BACT|nr:hypothetical protein [Pseudodesulfovibrio alkaliphilus]MUM78654.1 hypothetical protein [Pseudodesulfovibrio alkaliphilus]
MSIHLAVRTAISSMVHDAMVAGNSVWMMQDSCVVLKYPLLAKCAEMTLVRPFSPGATGYLLFRNSQVVKKTQKARAGCAARACP